MTTAYCRYVLLKKDERDPIAQRTAQLELQLLNDLHLRIIPGSADEAFLSDVRSHVISFSESLLRHRAIRFEAEALANKIFLMDEGDVEVSVRQQMAMGVLKFIAPIALFGTIGIAIAFTLRGALPHGTEVHTGILGPVFGLGSAFALVAYVSGIFWKRTTTRQMFVEFEHSKSLAREAYGKGIRLEYDMHWDHFKTAYERYSGRPYTELPWYRFNMGEDIVSDHKWTRRTSVHMMSNSQRLIRTIYRVQRLLWRRSIRSIRAPT